MAMNIRRRLFDDDSQSMAIQGTEEPNSKLGREDDGSSTYRAMPKPNEKTPIKNFIQYVMFACQAPPLEEEEEGISDARAIFSNEKSCRGTSPVCVSGALPFGFALRRKPMNYDMDDDFENKSNRSGKFWIGNSNSEINSLNSSAAGVSTTMKPTTLEKKISTIMKPMLVYRGSTEESCSGAVDSDSNNSLPIADSNTILPIADSNNSANENSETELQSIWRRGEFRTLASFSDDETEEIKRVEL